MALFQYSYLSSGVGFTLAHLYATSKSLLCQTASPRKSCVRSSHPLHILQMRRRTFRRIKAASPAAHHHHVYVVLLSSEAANLPEVRVANPNRNPSKPCVYVGMSGLSPDE